MTAAASALTGVVTDPRTAVGVVVATLRKPPDMPGSLPQDYGQGKSGPIQAAAGTTSGIEAALRRARASR